MKPSEKKRYSCIVLDDNPLTVSLLENVIACIDKLKLACSFTDPIKAMAAFQEYEMVDFLFIDIGMEVSGLDLARMIRNKVRFIVFITGYEQFEAKASEIGDAYLIKPINFDIVLKTVNELISKNKV